MMKGFDGRRRSARLAGHTIGVAALTLVCAAPELKAQTAPTNYSIDIPAKPLPKAIADLSAQTGLQVLYTGSQAFQHDSHSVSGRLSPEQALNQMLQGTGLNYHFVRVNAVTLDIPGQGSTAASTVPGAISLDAINVRGADQSAYGPGVGYFATNSAAGTKTDTPIIETPQSISVVTRQQMDDQQPQNVNQALRYTPGVVAENLGANSNVTTNGYLLARGFPATFLVDGLQPEAGGDLTFVDPYLINRIEVLSGPASVIYGQASPGGVIEADSKLPTETPIHEIILGGGNFNHIQGAFDVGGPVDPEGHFLYRLTGIGFSEDGQTNYTKQQHVAIAPAFTWRPDGDTTFTVLSNYTNNPSDGSTTYLPAYGTVLPNPNGKLSRNLFVGEPDYNNFSSQTASVGYHFERRFNDIFTITQNFKYWHWNDIQNVFFPAYLNSDLRTLNMFSAYQNVTGNAVLVDTHAQAKFSTGLIAHTVIFGVDYQHATTSEMEATLGTLPSVPLDIFAPVYALPPNFSDPPVNKVDTVWNQLGIYAQDQISLDRWRFLLGARGDFATEAQTQTTLATGITGPGFGHYNDSAPTWRAGLVYLFDNGLAPYFSYSTSFQPTTGMTFNSTPFLPTTGQQYEAGIKYQPPGWNSFITAAAYNLTEQNVATADPAHPGFNSQIGEVRVRGVELQGHANLTNNLDLMATYTYTHAIDAKDTSEDTDTTINGVTEPLQGKQLVQIPSQMASVWANYTIHDGPARGLGFGGGVRYVGWSWGDDVNSFKVPAYALVDAALHYDFGQANPSLRGLNLQVNVTNLFDKTYIASCGGTITCYYGLGRVVYATLKYDW